MRKYIYISVLLIFASTVAYASNVVPYKETFESYASGFEMSGTTGWSAAAISDAVVSDNAAWVVALNAYSKPCGYPIVTNHTKVLEVNGAVTNQFDMGANQIVWADYMSLPHHGSLPADANIPVGVQAAVGFNMEDHPAVWHYDLAGGTNRWAVVDDVAVPPGEWVRLTYALDYQTDDPINNVRYFQVRVDGTLLTHAMAWTTNDGSGAAGGSWFAMSSEPDRLQRFMYGPEGGDSALDDLILTSADPFLPVIESLKHSSGDIYRMVINFPEGNQMVLPSAYFPIKSTDLTTGSWDDSIMHSTNGVDGWLNADLDYSVTLGSSKAIYLESAEAAAFFGLGGGDVSLADGGQTAYKILLDVNASEPETHAADELAAFLQEVTSAIFPIVNEASNLGSQRYIAVGAGAAKTVSPNLDLSGLGQDGIILRTVGSNLILTGGTDSRRGTLYAVYTFLEDTVGCRWWTYTESTIPQKTALKLPPLDERYVPQFDYRSTFICDAFYGDWAVRNKNNGRYVRVDAQRGGNITYPYGYFVHSFSTLVSDIDPSDHPEWFSEIGGVRILPPERTQLCLSNPELLAHCIAEVRGVLGNAPPETIVSVSQNDWGFRCECEECNAIELEENSPSGLVLRFVNAIADAVCTDFPEARIDTLAYQYTRSPPTVTQPRSNVIVRLGDIECSFSRPLTDPVNQSFAQDAQGWSNICENLYIWDYITNFRHYLLPHPNLRVLGLNIDFFKEHGVKGVFEQGKHREKGSEFADLRAWVIAKLLWNPDLDANLLIQEFLDGYYGPAAPFISSYISLLHDEVESSDYFMRIYVEPTAPFLNADVLSQADVYFKNALAAVGGDAEYTRRVEMAYAPVQYAIVLNYLLLKTQSQTFGRVFDFEPYSDYLDDLVATCESNGIDDFAEYYKTLSTFKSLAYSISSSVLFPPSVPGFCVGKPQSDWFEVQDFQFELIGEGTWAEKMTDSLSSDGNAIRMPGNHSQWAIQMFAPNVVDAASSEWDVYVSVRVDKAGSAWYAILCGLYDRANPGSSTQNNVWVSDTSETEYRYFHMGTMDLPPEPVDDSHILWVSPDDNPHNVEAVWIDRFIFVRKP